MKFGRLPHTIHKNELKMDQWITDLKVRAKIHTIPRRKSRKKALRPWVGECFLGYDAKCSSEKKNR